jgi:3-hydroxyacyl-CoA dehydrogenase
MSEMRMKKVVVAGGGVLGSQIAYQSAFKGYDVTIWLRSEGSIERARPKLEHLHQVYQQTLEDQKKLIGQPLGPRLYARGLIDDFSKATPESIDGLKQQAEAAYADLRLETDLAKAVRGADIVIEAMAENPQQKKDFYIRLAPLLSEKTILCTNSSTLLPSMFAEDTGRPEKFLALHFANEIWKNNTAEVMGHPGTDPEVYQQVVEFAASIGMIPLQLHKEQPGYILNSLLVPFLNAAEELLVKGVADPETIDKTWQLGTGAPVGPFRILDVVGLQTAYNIVSNAPDATEPGTMSSRIAKLLESYIQQGKTGMSAGEGFYKYQ